MISVFVDVVGKHFANQTPPERSRAVRLATTVYVAEMIPWHRQRTQRACCVWRLYRARVRGSLRAHRFGLGIQPRQRE